MIEKQTNFGKISTKLPLPDLLDMQKQSFVDFLQLDVPPAKRELKGLQAAFEDVFPIEAPDGSMRLEFLKYEIEAADIGVENCLPDIHLNEYIRAPITLTDRVPKEESGHIGKGMIETLLPYCIQDGYNRKRKARLYDAAILENEHLKAVFIPELGGRLWSLYDKNEKRELLYKNGVYQPANLALRNAWFSGGIEWNIGIKGHNPLTCSPIFAA